MTAENIDPTIVVDENNAMSNDTGESTDAQNPIDNDKFSISSTDRLNEMLNEAEKELSEIQPEIEELEKSLVRLQELKQTKQKLITLKLSIQSILNNYTFEKRNKMTELVIENLVSGLPAKNSSYVSRPKGTGNTITAKELIAMQTTFYPDKAFEQASEILKQKSSLNYEFFRAIVFSGGRASTHVIKQYLIENNVTLPGSGETFDNVPLTDISARVSYLIRKGLVAQDGRGYFKSTVGWES